MWSSEYSKANPGCSTSVERFFKHIRGQFRDRKRKKYSQNSGNFEWGTWCSIYCRSIGKMGRAILDSDACSFQYLVPCRVIKLSKLEFSNCHIAGPGYCRGDIVRAHPVDDRGQHQVSLGCIWPFKCDSTARLIIITGGAKLRRIGNSDGYGRGRAYGGGRSGFRGRGRGRGRVRILVNCGCSSGLWGSLQDYCMNEGNVADERNE